MLLFFDFDGTLIDVKRKYFAVYDEFVQLYKGRTLSINEFWSMKRMTLSNDEILRASGIHNVDPESLREYIKENVEKEIYLRLDVLFQDSERTLKTLSQKYTCYLVSMRRNRAMFLTQVQWLGIKMYFREIISPYEFDFKNHLTDTRKSDALKRLDISMPAMIIGDSGLDLITGRNLDIYTCAVTTGIRERSVLESYNPDYIIDSLDDIHGVIESISTGEGRLQR